MGSETLGQLLATCFPTKLCKEEPTLFSVFPFLFFFSKFSKFCLRACLCTIRVPSAYGGQERTLDPLGL